MFSSLLFVSASLALVRALVASPSGSVCAQRVPGEELWDRPGTPVKYHRSLPAHPALDISRGVFVAPLTATYLVTVTIEVARGGQGGEKRTRRRRKGYWLGGSGQQYRKLKLGKVRDYVQLGSNAFLIHFIPGSSFTFLPGQEPGVSSMSVQLALEEGGRVFLLQDRGAHPATQVG